MSIDWHELAKEKPPNNGWYLICGHSAPIDSPIEVDFFGANKYGEPRFIDPPTHWAYLTPPGEMSKDDLRLGRILGDVADWMVHEFSTGTRELELGQAILHQVEQELEARFGPDWELGTITTGENNVYLGNLAGVTRSSTDHCKNEGIEPLPASDQTGRSGENDA